MEAAFLILIIAWIILDLGLRWRTVLRCSLECPFLAIGYLLGSRFAPII